MYFFFLQKKQLSLGSEIIVDDLTDQNQSNTEVEGCNQVIIVYASFYLLLIKLYLVMIFISF